MPFNEEDGGIEERKDDVSFLGLLPREQKITELPQQGLEMSKYEISEN